MLSDQWLDFIAGNAPLPKQQAPKTDKYAVVYNLFDEDHALFVKHESEACQYKDGEQAEFWGTQKECRRYVIENQHKRATPSLLRYLK